MVYRGRSGADPEKKGEDVFPCVLISTVNFLGVRGNQVWERVRVVSELSLDTTHLDKGYSPTDVLSCLPGTTDVLDVLYHVSHVVISAWLCFALIIHNSGDNHWPGAN